MGTQLPSPKRGRSPFPIFGPCLLWPNCWMDQGGTWHGGGPWSRPHCARWGHSSPPPKKGQSPPFLAYVYCGQTAGWIKTPLAMEVDLGPNHIVLDGDQAPPRKGHSSPRLFGPCLLWPQSPISATDELLFINFSAKDYQNQTMKGAIAITTELYPFLWNTM